MCAFGKSGRAVAAVSNTIITRCSRSFDLLDLVATGQVHLFEKRNNASLLPSRNTPLQFGGNARRKCEHHEREPRIA